MGYVRAGICTPLGRSAEIYNRHDSNDLLERDGLKLPKFEQFDSGAVEKLSTSFVKYVSHVYAVETGQGNSNPHQKLEFQERDIPRDTNGIPLLPPPFLNSRGMETALTQQRIIRFLVNAHYSLCFSMTLHDVSITD